MQSCPMVDGPGGLAIKLLEEFTVERISSSISKDRITRTSVLSKKDLQSARWKRPLRLRTLTVEVSRPRKSPSSQRETSWSPFRDPEGTSDTTIKRGAIQSTLALAVPPVYSSHLSDEAKTEADRLSECIFSHEITILSGGYRKERETGFPRPSTIAPKAFHGVAQSPGKPFGVWTTENRTIFALPGSPVSTLVGATVGSFLFAGQVSGLATPENRLLGKH